MSHKEHNATWNAMVGALQGDSAKVEALETRIKAAENARLVAESKLAQVRQAINTLHNA